MSATTGTISGTIAAGAATDGPYSVTLLAGDGTSSAKTTLTWNVNSPVTIATPDDQTNSAGDTVSLSIGAGDATGRTLTFAATGLPPGLSISSGTGLISGTPTIGGAWQTTVTAGDGTYSASATFAWNVGDPITITEPGDQANAVGNSVAVQVQATDSGSGTLSYSGTVPLVPLTG